MRTTSSNEKKLVETMEKDRRLSRARQKLFEELLYNCHDMLNSVSAAGDMLDPIAVQNRLRASMRIKLQEYDFSK